MILQQLFCDVISLQRINNIQTKIKEQFQRIINPEQQNNSYVFNECIKFEYILKEYLQQPQLIENVCQECCQQLNDLIIRQLQQKTQKYEYYYVYYSIIQLQGLRKVERYVNNNVELFNDILNSCKQCMQNNSMNKIDLLQSQDKNNQLFNNVDQTTFIQALQFRYQFFFIYWLNILIQSPFQLIDITDVNNFEQFLNQIYNEQNTKINKLSQMINELYARYYCRSDCIQKLQQQIEQLNKRLYITKNKYQQANILQTLCFITRFQPSNFIIPITDLNKFDNIRKSDNREIRKLVVILSMRICSRQLSIALLNTTTKAIAQSLPQSFDFFIDTLLKLLDTSEPTTRQICAISLAKVTSLLPDLFKEELIDELLSYLSPEQSAETYSGTLVALGEIVRLNAMQQITQINQLLNSLIETQHIYFDTKESLVSDALAFCLWCIGRSQLPQILQQNNLIQQISGNLVATSLLDFNLSTRRSSAAAFQQLCGSFGEKYISNAIRVASIPDFLQISDINYCYEKLALQICNLDQLYIDSFSQWIFDKIGIQQDFNKQKLMGILIGNLVIICNQNNYQMKDQLLQLINMQLLQLLQQEEDFICQSAGACIIYGCRKQNLEWVKIKNIIIQQIQLLNEQNNQLPQYQILQSFAIVIQVLIDNQIQFNENELQIIIKFCTLFFKQTLTKHLNIISLTTYDIIYKNEFLNMMKKISISYNIKWNQWNELSVKSALPCCQLTIVNQYQHLFEKSKEPITNLNRLYLLQSLVIWKEQLLSNQQTIQEYKQFLIDFLTFCTNDFSVDKRGEVGQQVRHKTLLVLNEIYDYLISIQQSQTNSNLDNYQNSLQFLTNDIQKIYINCILLACSSRSDYLKFDGLMSLKHLVQTKSELISQTYLIQLNCYLQSQNEANSTIQQQSNDNNTQNDNNNATIYDINELTNEEMKNQIDKQNINFIKNSYKILDILCKSNKAWSYIIYKQLVYDITFCSENELNWTLKIIKIQKQQEFYNFLISQFNNSQQTTYQLGMNYAILVTLQFLIYFDFQPEFHQIVKLLTLIQEFLQFQQINFYSFGAAFNIYCFIIQWYVNDDVCGLYKNDKDNKDNISNEEMLDIKTIKQLKQYCKRQLISYLNNQTLKLRQQACEAIVECCILSKQENIINTLLKQDVMNLKLNQCNELMKEVEQLWL